jgi:hypothetical protein
VGYPKNEMGYIWGQEKKAQAIWVPGELQIPPGIAGFRE